MAKKEELRITFQATGGLKERINKYATENELTQSEAIRSLINKGLNDQSDTIFDQLLKMFGYESPQDVPNEKLSAMGQIYSLAAQIVGE